MSAIRYLPVATFATLMGSAGLTLAWEKGAQVFGLPVLVSQLLLGFTLLLLAVLGSSYLVKFLKHRDAVCEEFNHPIKISFFVRTLNRLDAHCDCTASVSGAASADPLGYWCGAATGTYADPDEYLDSSVAHPGESHNPSVVYPNRRKYYCAY